MSSAPGRLGHQQQDALKCDGSKPERREILFFLRLTDDMEEHHDKAEGKLRRQCFLPHTRL